MARYVPAPDPEANGKRPARTSGQRARDRAKIAELHCIGYTAQQITDKMRGITAGDGYTLTKAVVDKEIELILKDLSVRVEISKQTHRNMMLYRLQRRRAQLEEELLWAIENEEIESQARRREQDGKVSTEAVTKRRKRRPSMAIFEQLNSVDRMEMELLGLAYRVTEDGLGGGDDLPDAGYSEEMPAAIDYDAVTKMLIDSSLGLPGGAVAPKQAAEPEPVRPAVVDAVSYIKNGSHR